MDLVDVREILEQGVDCAKDRRKKETFERCLEDKDRIIKVIHVKGIKR